MGDGGLASLNMASGFAVHSNDQPFQIVAILQSLDWGWEVCTVVKWRKLGEALFWVNGIVGGPTFQVFLSVIPAHCSSSWHLATQLRHREN